MKSFKKMALASFLAGMAITTQQVQAVNSWKMGVCAPIALYTGFKSLEACNLAISLLGSMNQINQMMPGDSGDASLAYNFLFGPIRTVLSQQTKNMFLASGILAIIAGLFGKLTYDAYHEPIHSKLETEDSSKNADLEEDSQKRDEESL